MTRFLLCLASLALLLGPPTPAIADVNTSTGPSLAGLVGAGTRWKQFYEAGDWSTLRSLYADDAVLMSQGQPKIEGADAILVFLQRLSQQGATVTFAFVPEEAKIEGDLGIVTAKYRMDITFPGRDPVAVAGRSLLIYKWQDSSWKLWRDIDNFAPDVTPDNIKLEDFE